METTLVGIDCATDPRKVGLALGQLSGKKTRLLAAITGDRSRPLAERIVDWISASERALLALDAPLGWPAGLGAALVHHQAGEPVAGQANTLFRRTTDRVVKQRLGKQPLDVGADRIARTALMAVGLLQQLRELTGQAIPLAWQSKFEHPLAAIEVYPAGTLRVHGLPDAGYKEADSAEVRDGIISGLRKHLELPADTSMLRGNSDVLDAAVCVLAAQDFLSVPVIQPQSPQEARKEGWIWVRRPHGSGVEL